MQSSRVVHWSVVIALAVFAGVARPAGAIPRGDCNCDGVINGKDIQAWVDAFLNPTAYATRNPTCSRCTADLDGDGSVTAADRPILINCALGLGACTAAAPCFCPLPAVPSGGNPPPNANAPGVGIGQLADYNDQNVVVAAGAFPEIPDSILQQDGRDDFSPSFVATGQDGVAGFDLSGRIRYPSTQPGGVNAAAAAGGPFPLVVIAHGNHRRFADAVGGDPSDENYRGYTYLQNRLATHGFITVSIDLDDFTDLLPGILSRAWLILCTIERMEAVNAAAGPLQNQIDMTRIALIGHSRGGDAVIQAVRLNAAGLVPGVGPGAATGGFQIRAVWGIASTRFFDGAVNWDRTAPIQGVVPASVLTAQPFFGMWGDADGDVTGEDITIAAGVTTKAMHVEGSYDGSTAQPKQFAWIEGANHNFWNSSWFGGAFGDDGLVFGTSCVATRITSAEQQDLALAYGVAFLRAYVRNEAAYADYFKFPANALPPVAVAQNRAHLQYQQTAANRRVVDDFEMNCALDTTSRGTAGVTNTLVTPIEGLLIGARAQPLPANDPAPCAAAVSTQSWYHLTRGLLFDWTAAANQYETVLPAAERNVSGFATLSFRVAQDRRGAGSNNALAFDVVLTDNANVSATVRTDAVTTLPVHQPRIDGQCSQDANIACRTNANCGGANTCNGIGLLTKSMLKTVRIPLCRFREAQNTINLNNIVRVRFTNFSRAAGKAAIDDIEFAN